MLSKLYALGREKSEHELRCKVTAWHPPLSRKTAKNCKKTTFLTKSGDFDPKLLIFYQKNT